MIICFQILINIGPCQNLLWIFFTKIVITAQKMKFSIKDFFSKCDQIRSFLQIWSHLLKKSLMKNFIFCAVIVESSEFYNCHLTFNLFSNNASFLYTLKTSESLKFSDVFRRCRSKILVENEGVDYFLKKTLS